MGYYDGVGGIDTRASAYDIARITETPEILVMDGKGASLSLAATVKGFAALRKDSRIEGIILNRTSPSVCGPIERTDRGGDRNTGCGLSSRFTGIPV